MTPLIILLLPILLLLTPPVSPTYLGVTYTHPPNTPPPTHLPTLLTTLNITSLRLPSPDPTLIRSFSYTPLSLLLSLPNPLIPYLASNLSNAATWLYSHVVPFYPRAHISIISLGDDVPPSLSPSLLPALRNLHVSLHTLGIRTIHISTTFSLLNIVTPVFPPSSSHFSTDTTFPMGQFLDFLEESNSTFLVNVHPYDLYRQDMEIPAGFALFQEGEYNYRDDYTTGVRYRNLYDTMVDSLVCALAVAGHENIPIIVSQTGWPSAPGGEMGEGSDANVGFAEMYLNGLLRNLRSGFGTPLKKDGVVGVYVYELFDREVKPQGQNGNNGSSVMVRQWGILYPNLTEKYHVKFSGGGSSVVVEKSWVVVCLVVAVVGLFLQV